jgi:hypothetical protein
MCIRLGVVRHFAAVTLVVLLLVPSAFANPKPLDPVTVHARVLKRGVGRWIALEERDGIDLFGRIISIGDTSFTLQLHNDPQTTEVLYSDVAYLRTGFTTGQKVFMVAGFGAVAGLSIWGFIHVHDLANKPLTSPSTPAFP